MSDEEPEPDTSGVEEEEMEGEIDGMSSIFDEIPCSAFVLLLLLPPSHFVVFPALLMT